MVDWAEVKQYVYVQCVHCYWRCLATLPASCANHTCRSGAHPLVTLRPLLQPLREVNTPMSTCMTSKAHGMVAVCTAASARVALQQSGCSLDPVWCILLHLVCFVCNMRFCTVVQREGLTACPPSSAVGLPCRSSCQPDWDVQPGLCTFNTVHNVA